MATLLSLTKDRDDALASVAAATTSKARAKAAGELQSASLALATFQANQAAKKADRIGSKAEEEEERAEEEEDEDEEEDDEPKKPMEDDEEEESEDDEEEDDEEDDDDDDDDEEEDEEDEEEEKAKEKAIASVKSLQSLSKSPKHRAAVKASVKSLRSAFSKIGAVATRRSTRAQAMSANAKAQLNESKKLRAACVALTGQRKTSKILTALGTFKVDAMIAQARRDGKIDAKQAKVLRGLDASTVKTFVDVSPALVRSTEKGALEGRDAKTGEPGARSKPGAIDASNMSDDQRKILAPFAQAAGQSVEDFAANIGKRTSAIAASQPKN